MVLSYCQRSDLKIRRSILHQRGLRRCQQPSKLQRSDHLMLGVTQTQKLSHSCLNKTTFRLTLVQCRHYVRQSLSLNPQAMREELLVQILMVQPLENLASQPTAKCLPTFRQRPTRQLRHSCHQHTSKYLNAHHHRFNKRSAWMMSYLTSLMTEITQP